MADPMMPGNPWFGEIRKQKHVRVMTVEGQYFDFIAPEEFKLISLVTSIRASGYFCNDAVYIPVELLGPIFVYDTDRPPPKLASVTPLRPDDGSAA